MLLPRTPSHWSKSPYYPPELRLQHHQCHTPAVTALVKFLYIESVLARPENQIKFLYLPIEKLPKLIYVLHYFTI